MKTFARCDCRLCRAKSRVRGANWAIFWLRSHQPSPIFLKLLPHLLHCTGPPTLLCSSVSSTSYSFFTHSSTHQSTNTHPHCSSKRSLPLLQLPSPLLRLPAIIELCPFLTKHSTYSCSHLPCLSFPRAKSPFFPHLLRSLTLIAFFSAQPPI